MLFLFFTLLLGIIKFWHVERVPGEEPQELIASIVPALSPHTMRWSQTLQKDEDPEAARRRALQMKAAAASGIVVMVPGTLVAHQHVSNNLNS